jgi:hypothetical protein
MYNKFACKDDRVKRTCDFKSLPLKKGAILKRMRDETVCLQGVVAAGKSGASEQALRVALDKAAGMVIMSNVLKEKFRMTSEDIRRALGTKKVSWSERAKLALMAKVMQKERG